jgi:transketolase
MKKINKITKSEILELEKIAYELRVLVIDMLEEAKSGHTAGPLGMADIFSALYFKYLNINPDNPYELNRDRLILSNGHICPILYASLAKKGFFPIDELKTLRKINSRLQGHPHNLSLPGVENSSGPLGQGISIGLGCSIHSTKTGHNFRTYIIGSDGELNEGQTWEAIMFAGSNKLKRITYIIDKNNIQLSGDTKDILNLDNLTEKFESFGWYVLEIDGNNMEEICLAISKSMDIINKPVVIIASTIPGKGVDFIEYKFSWHGKPPSKEEAQRALFYLEKNYKNEKK